MSFVDESKLSADEVNGDEIVVGGNGVWYEVWDPSASSLVIDLVRFVVDTCGVWESHFEEFLYFDSTGRITRSHFSFHLFSMSRIGPKLTNLENRRLSFPASDTTIPTKAAYLS